jgi:hypothetical protein
VTALELLGRARGTLEAARPGAARAARWAWEHRTVVLAIAVVLLLALNVRACRRAGDAEGRAAAAEKRGAGEVAAAAAGVPVVHEAPQATVDAEAERARRENPLLAARLARAERELGKIRLELVARVRTEPAAVGGAPRPASFEVGKEATPPVALLVGDQLHLEADLAVARTPAGAHVLEGTLAAWRVLDGELLLRQPFSAPVTFAVETSPGTGPPAHQDRVWRIGAVGGASGQGWLAGGAYARRLDVWGWRPEVLVAGAAGPGGVMLLGGGLF